uniref:Uncharacterized protein n=1 Tax=Arundo donax TaxID=35708 RepID=A0A0A9FI46_ARUDO
MSADKFFRQFLDKMYHDYNS